LSDTQKRIVSECPMFACRKCRTKAGWPHQAWCPVSGAVRSDCTGCVYSDGKGGCVHPTKRKERDVL
jgi:hypothetical protein